MLRALAFALPAVMLLGWSNTSLAQKSDEPEDIRALARTVISGDFHQSRKALNSLVARGNKDIVSSLVLADALSLSP